MDIQIYDSNTLKIKNKKTVLAIDPKKTVSKFDADAIILADKAGDISRVNNFRVVIDGPGEYEVLGLKVSGIKSGGDIMYSLSTENVNTLVAKSSTLSKVSADMLGEYKIVIINADSQLNQSAVTAMEPRIVVLYGEKKKEGAKALGRENIQSLSKITLSEDKFPEELEVVLLE